MSDAGTIKGRREAWLAAFNAENIPAMTNFLAEDHVGMPPNQAQMHGLQAAQEFWRIGYSMGKSTIVVRPRSLDVAGDLAVDRFDYDMMTIPHDGGPGMKDTGKCVWIWRRGTDGAWRLAQAIWNSDLDKPGPWSGG